MTKYTPQELAELGRNTGLDEINRLTCENYIKIESSEDKPRGVKKEIVVYGGCDASPEMTKKYLEWEKDFLTNKVKWYPPNRIHNDT